MLAACRALGVGAKIELGEGLFCRFCRLIAGYIAQKSGEIGTVQMDLQPISLKFDRLLGAAPLTKPPPSLRGCSRSGMVVL